MSQITCYLKPEEKNLVIEAARIVGLQHSSFIKMLLIGRSREIVYDGKKLELNEVMGNESR